MVRGGNGGDAETAPDVDAHAVCARSERGFERVHVDGDIGIGRRRQAPGPLRGVDVLLIELETGEMTGGPARLLHPVCGTLDRTRRRALRGQDIVKQTAPVKGFRRGQRQAAQAERKLLQRRVRIRCLFQHQHRETAEPQLAGEKQADRSGTGNDDVVDIEGLGSHETLLWSMFDRSVP